MFGIPNDLDEPVETSPNNLYNLDNTNGQNFESPIIKEWSSTELNKGLKLIEDTKTGQFYKYSIKANKLKEFLKTVPSIPTQYVTYAFNNDKREALSLLVQYTVEIDM